MQIKFGITAAVLGVACYVNTSAQTVKPVSPTHKSGDATKKHKEPTTKEQTAKKPTTNSTPKPSQPSTTRVPPIPVASPGYDRGGRLTPNPNGGIGYVPSGGGQTPQKK